MGSPKSAVPVPVLVISAASLAGIFGYLYLMRAGVIPDFMDTTLFNHPLLERIDLWSVAHLLFYAAVGYLDPGRFLLYFMIGVAFEFVEEWGIFNVGSTDRDASGATDWYGKSSDIAVNALGYMIGSHLSPRRCKCGLL